MYLTLSNSAMVGVSYWPVPSLSLSFSFLYSSESDNSFMLTNEQEVVSQDPMTVQQKVAREFTVHIDRLANIFRYD